MIALPCAALTVIDLVAHASDLDPAAQIERDLGPADALITRSSTRGEFQIDGTATPQFRFHGRGSMARGGQRLRSPLALLPDATRLVQARTGHVVFAEGEGVAVAELVSAPLSDPLVSGHYTLRDGAFPATDAEVALSPELASALNADPGDCVTLRSGVGGSLRVSGVVEDPAQLGLRIAYSPAGLSAASRQGHWYAELPGPLGWDEVGALNRAGFLAEARRIVGPGPKESPSSTAAVGAAGVAGGALVAAMALLEMALLIGPAFAIGARRRRRELALIAATGADPRQIRRAMLAEAGAIGLAGSLAGLVLGGAVFFVAHPWFESIAGSRYGALDLRPIELAAIGLIGVAIALLAAVVPSRAAARRNPLAELGEHRARLSDPRVPIAIGLTAALLGVLLMVVAVEQRHAEWIVAAAALVQAGGAILAPLILLAVGPLARRLPLAPRIALREAARNRSRTGPALAAIMTAVAGVALALVAVNSYGAGTANMSASPLRPGQSLAELPASLSDHPKRIEAVATAVGRELPVDGISRVGIARSASCRRCAGGSGVLLSGAIRCGQGRARGDVRECLGEVANETIDAGFRVPDSILIDNGNALAAISGRSDEGAERALAGGEAAIVFDERLLDRTGRLWLANEGRSGTKTLTAVPGHLVRGDPHSSISAVLPPRLARAAGLVAVPGLITEPAAVPSIEQVADAEAALRLATGSVASLETSQIPAVDLPLLGLLGLALIVAVGATTMVTALGASEARHDRATLRALGAAPTVVRRTAAWGAAIIAGIGGIVGVLAGALPGIAAVSVGLVQGTDRAHVPWEQLIALAIVLPLAAALAAALITRTRLPLEHRLD